MAADEVLVRTAAAHGIASLRFYGWSEATLSLGYFQPASVRLADPLLAALPYVRRPSGGAALVHHHEVTYALAVPPGKEWHTGGPWMPRMHTAIAHAFVMYVYYIALAEAEEKRGTVLCFQHVTTGDVLSDGNKVVGSAQRKFRGALLQHGAILLSRSEYAPALPGLQDLPRIRPLEAATLRTRVVDSFAWRTGWQMTPATWTVDERIAIAALVREKYGTPEWNERR